ncbi:MAG TPA: adenylate/guanylate cyclase domain-containing protein [Flavipsychrobacter sp.]
MKKLLTILLLYIAIHSTAQTWTGGVTHLTKDSVATLYNLEENWLFHNGDNMAWAAKDYNDSQWMRLDPQLKYKKGIDSIFKGNRGWFRVHIYIDSSLKNQQLALRVAQYGASEIYLDGVKIITYGKIHPHKDSVEYFDPHGLPVAIGSLDPGKHVIAVRYVNHYAKEEWLEYKNAVAGFEIELGAAARLFQNYKAILVLAGISLLILVGFFVALGMSHFFMWLYHRKAISNLYFSIFCISVGSALFLPYIKFLTNNPSHENTVARIGLMLGVFITITLSGVSNALFSKKKLRFGVVALVCTLPLIIMYFQLTIAIVVYIICLIMVTLESIILTLRAIYRKAKGARIIGVGILFTTLFFFVIFVLSLFNNGLSIGDGIAGKAFVSLAVAAVLSIPVSMSIYLAMSFAETTKNLDKQLQQVQVLSAKTLEQELEKQRMLENRGEELEREVAARTSEIQDEKKKSDELLRNILPEEVAEELKQKGVSAARHFDHVSVLFTDFVDFTKAGERLTPQQLVDELHACFKAFDEIISSYHIEKIKTIGDAYLAVCGLPTEVENHAENTVRAALDIMAFMQERREKRPDTTFDIRIGIHSGAVVAGIVGVKKFAYDIWGDTVNTAARMEQSSLPGKINISKATCELINDKFAFSYRGEIAAKNKGDMDMYFVEGLLT